MPRHALTDDEVDVTRERLCEAALGLFRDGGLDAISFRQLAERLRVSHTLPYRYFSNKEALLAGVRVACFERFDNYVRACERPDAQALEQVHAVLGAYVSFVFDHLAEYTLIFVTPQPPPVRYPDLLAARRRMFEHSVALLQRCIDEDVVRGDARLLTHSIWGSLHGLLSLHVANQLVHGCTLQDLVLPTVDRLLGVSWEAS